MKPYQFFTYQVLWKFSMMFFSRRFANADIMKQSMRISKHMSKPHFVVDRMFVTVSK